ncbi:MAG: hypothetical protein ACREE2_00810 [Stellaceae bacterium]
MLGITAVDGFSEAFWGCVGAAFAALPAAIESIWGAWLTTPPQSLTVVHLVEVSIVVAALSAAATLRLVTRRKVLRTRDRIKAIRQRQQETIG